MATIKIYKAKKNVQFTHNSINRPSFKVKGGGTVAEEKTKFINEYFPSAHIAGTFNEIDTLNATVRLTLKNIEEDKKLNYIMIDIDGFKRFYFVMSSKINNNNTISYGIKLDVITTYLDMDSVVDGNFILEMGHTNGSISDLPLKEMPHPYVETIQKVDIAQKYKETLSDDEKHKFDIYHTLGKYSLTALIKPKSGATTTDNGHVNVIMDMIRDGIAYTPVRLASTDTDANRIDKLLFQNSAQVMSAYITPLPFVESLRKDSNHNYYADSNTVIEYQDVPRAELYFSVPNPIKIDETDEIADDTLPIWDKPFDIKAKIEAYSTVVKHANGDMKPSNVFGRLDHWSHDTIDLRYKQTLESSGGSMLLFFPFSNDSTQNYFLVKNRQNRAILSNAYQEYMNRSSSSISNSREMIKLQGAQSVVGGLGQTLTSAAQLNPIGAVKGLIGTIFGGLQANKRLDRIKSQMKDLKRTPSEVLSPDSHVTYYELVGSDPAFMYGDSGFNIVFLYVGKYLESELHNHYYKFGYDVDINVNAGSYDALFTRETFTYIQSPNFSDCLNKEKLNVEIIDEMERLFQTGVRLWAWKTSHTSTSGIVIENYCGEFGIRKDGSRPFLLVGNRKLKP